MACGAAAGAEIEAARGMVSVRPVRHPGGTGSQRCIVARRWSHPRRARRPPSSSRWRRPSRSPLSDGERARAGSSGRRGRYDQPIDRGPRCWRTRRALASSPEAGRPQQEARVRRGGMAEQILGSLLTTFDGGAPPGGQPAGPGLVPWPARSTMGGKKRHWRRASARGHRMNRLMIADAAVSCRHSCGTDGLGLEAVRR